MERPITSAPPGPVPVETMKSLSGIDVLRGIASGELPGLPMAALLNYWLRQIEPGYVVFEGKPGYEHYNPMGSVHGGFAATLLDSAMACAVYSKLNAGQSYTTLEIKISYIRALTAATGPVRAEGKIISVGRQVGTAEGRLVDGTGKLYAHGTTTCLVFNL